MLSEVNSTLQELQRLHQLNIELLEQLDVTFSWLLDNHIKLPNESAFYSLVLKARALMIEIQAGEPNIQYKKLADEFLQRKLTDKDFTEPDYSLRDRASSTKTLKFDREITESRFHS